MSSNLSWIDKIYFINLDRSKERREKCLAQGIKYNLPLERFPAIEGAKLTEEQKKDVHPICKYFLCTNGMMGCGLSHYYLLKKIIDEKIPTTIILEDDFIWREDTNQKLENLKHFYKGIVKLSCIGPFCGGPNYQVSTSRVVDVEEPHIAPFALGTAAYLIRYEHAKLLYEKMKNIKYHIDVQSTLVSKLNSIPIYSYDCVDVEGMDDSTVGLHQKTLLNAYLPLSNDIKWFLNEPFIAPFGYGIHLFLVMSILLIILGLIAYRWNQWIGILLIGLGVFDILYYFLQ
jgi:GR25 family glycosyltransferase involved in LPS biosynthesis